jgi:protoporphyrinogen IX oxidase
MFTYQALTAIHTLAIIIFAGGMVFLPRLMLANAPQAVVQNMLRWWITPAFIAVWLFGILLLKQNPMIMKMGWMHSKLSLVLLFTAYHGYVAFWRKRQSKGVALPGHFTVLQFLPLILTVLIVALVILKPF